MERYIGMDAHAASCTLAVSTGKTSSLLAQRQRIGIVR